MIGSPTAQLSKHSKFHHLSAQLSKSAGEFVRDKVDPSMMITIYYFEVGVTRNRISFHHITRSLLSVFLFFVYKKPFPGYAPKKKKKKLPPASYDE